MKTDQIIDRLGSIDRTLAAQHESLRDHMRRTDLLEKAIIPVTKQMNMINGAGKLIAFLGIAVTILEFIHRMFK
jgi:hypothetical protein